MLKKLLATSLACIMVLSSMAVVSLADTNTEPQEWVENFDAYGVGVVNSTSTNGPIYENQPRSSDEIKAQLAYLGISNTGSRFRRINLASGWMIGNANMWDTTVITGTQLSIESGRGKSNNDKYFAITKSYRHRTNLLNPLDYVARDVSKGGSLKFSFDWSSNETQNHNIHLANRATISALVVMGDASYTIPLAKIGVMDKEPITAGDNTNLGGSFETWNSFDAMITSDGIYVRGYETGKVHKMNISDFDTSTSKFVSGTNSNLTIDSVKAIKITTEANSDLVPQALRLDNLNIRYSSADATFQGYRATPKYVDFTGVQASQDSNEGGGMTFMQHGQSVALRDYTYALSQNSANGTVVMAVDIMKDDNNKKTPALANGNDTTDGYLRIKNVETTALGNSSTLAYFYVGNGSNVANITAGDFVQFSCKIKVPENVNASPKKSLISIHSDIEGGAGRFVGVSGNGTVLDGSDTNVALAKLKSNEWYNVDIMCEVKDDSTEAVLYLNGKKILTKSLNGESVSDSALRLVYSPEINEENTGYIENTVYLDELCYMVFKGGEGRYNFDKSASTANNAAIANADVDFVNNTIFPVSNDWTVADFYNLELRNAVVTDANGNELTVASDGNKTLVGNKIKFTGDYGKDVSFTVSGEGGQNVTENSFVTLRENLGNTFAASANAGKLLTAKAVNGNSNLEVYIAEYSNNELVGLTVGKGVANYTPKAQGNKIKVLIWNEGELVPVFTGAAYELNVQ